MSLFINLGINLNNQLSLSLEEDCVLLQLGSNVLSDCIKVLYIELLRYGNAETSLKEMLCSSGGEMQTQNFDICDIMRKQYKLINIHLLHN